MVETPILKTNRLLLRPFDMSDLDDVYKWCSDIEATRYLFWYPHLDKDVTSRLLSSWTRKKRNYSWAIDYQGKAIGEIQLIKELDGRGAEIGYTLSKDFWRQGFMSEALKEVLGFLKYKGYVYAYACSDSRNIPSIRLLESLGFSKLGERPYHIDKKSEDITLSEYRKLL